LLARDATLPTLVQSVSLDAANDGYVEFLQAYGYDEVIISVANVYAGASATYSYTCEDYRVLLFENGFESGDTTSWSATVP
jgi:hypothetical protein